MSRKLINNFVYYTILPIVFICILIYKFYYNAYCLLFYICDHLRGSNAYTEWQNEIKKHEEEKEKERIMQSHAAILQLATRRKLSVRSNF